MWKRCSLQQIFEQGLDEVEQKRALHPRERRAAHSIRDCFTAAMGGHTVACVGGDFEAIQFHACRHRSCPRCAEAARQRWIEAELKRLLPCEHFHAVFTIAHSLLPLWEHNRSWFINTLFDSARDSLLQLMADPRRLGAVPGLLMSLHTWGRNLSHHPHVHCLVSAGGVAADGTWRATRKDWLLPVQPLKKLYRGKLLDALWHALPQLTLPSWTTVQSWRAQIKGLYRKPFNVEIRPPYEHGRGVVLYLARYAKGGPVPANRVLMSDGSRVQFPYTEHGSGQPRTLCLSTEQFIEQLLWHAPPAGVHTTRHAGLYTSSRREQHALACTALIGTADPAVHWPRPGAQVAEPATRPARPPAPRCPHCGGPLVRLARFARAPRTRVGAGTQGEISLSVPPRATGPPGQAHRRGPTHRSSGHPTAGSGAAPQSLTSSSARHQTQPWAAA